eukprot:1495243-Pyramimonas_sp.AAC.2
MAHLKRLCPAPFFWPARTVAFLNGLANLPLGNVPEWERIRQGPMKLEWQSGQPLTALSCAMQLRIQHS